MRLNHGVHHFVAANDGVGRADLDAQGAADAPVFIDKSDCSCRFHAIRRIQWRHVMAGDAAQPLNTFGTTGRALVDLGVASGDGLGVGLAVRVATARALGLGQGGTNECNPAGIQAGECYAGHHAYFLGAATHVVLTLLCGFSTIKGLDTTLGAGLAAALLGLTSALGGATLVTALTVA